ncbi:MAG: hypothetical protein JJ866_10080 [Roseibium sp.]|uniref:hypothetical protein n=1 Tax=Roseibium sp. TaxID=1936156 RepID=UPI001B285CE2|nr:hypothetical protein [Roseibium sp.]MBO6892275.1 hypothetical protein [Roseibium sp.]MBO6930861.1 hypothetical protein [Roseibium sp.]
MCDPKFDVKTGAVPENNGPFTRVVLLKMHRVAVGFFTAMVTIFIFGSSVVAGESAFLLGESENQMNFKVPSPNTIGINLLEDLANRVWLSEFNGGVALTFYDTLKQEFCGEDIKSPIEGTPEYSVLREHRPRALVAWPYKCRPVRIQLDHVSKNTAGETDIFVEMLEFESVDMVLPRVYSLVESNRLGSYKIDKEKYGVISDHARLVNWPTALSNKKSVESKAWLDSDEETSNFEDEFAKYEKSRLLKLKMSEDRFDSKDGIVTYKVRVPENFFTKK